MQWSKRPPPFTFLAVLIFIAIATAMFDRLD